MWRDRVDAARLAGASAEAEAWAIVGAVHRRLLVTRLVEAAGVGLVLTGVLGLALSLSGSDAGWRIAIVAGAATAVAVSWADARLRRPAALVAWFDATMPPLRNQLVTLHELSTGQLSSPPYVRQHLARGVLSGVAKADLAALTPLRRGVSVAVAGVLAVATWLVVGAAAVAHPAITREADAPPAGPRAVGDRRIAALGRVHVSVQPPAYSGLVREDLVDPERISALAGSRIVVEVDATYGGVTLASHRATPVSLDRVAPGRFRGQLEAVDPGFLVVALEPDRDAGTTGALRRLIALHVDDDRSPAVRLTAPGRDLLLADADRRVELAVEAEDDFGLDDLRLTYTIVSGSGETFDFTEGALPLAIVRESPMRWRGRGDLSLAALGVRAGDMVVYRAVAADRREGPARFGASETYVVEIAQQRFAAMADFELPDDQARYALSQQMVLVKTERLHARRNAIAPATLLEQSMALGAEQRMVRAEFVFMMGGDVEDEEEEAAHSHEIQEGRLENQGRRELVRAIQHMSESERALNVGDTGHAMPAQRAAIEMLQRAFGRSRYILRTLPTRAQIDTTRRLSGELDEVGPSIGRRSREAEPADRALIATLSALVSLGRRLSEADTTDTWRPELARAAEAVLALDPTSETLAHASQGLLAVAGDPTAGAVEAIEALSAAVSSVSRGLPSGGVRPSLRSGAVAGELADALRPNGGPR